jgi:hypothetical protein
MERAEAGIRTYSAEGHPHDPIKLQMKGLFPTASSELLSRKEKGPSMGRKLRRKVYTDWAPAARSIKLQTRELFPLAPPAAHNELAKQLSGSVLNQ